MNSPNWVSITLTTPDGAIERREGRNLITTKGIDLIAAGIGGGTAVQGSPATATTGTTFTATATPWTIDALIGKIVVFPITNITTTPVHGHILDNTTSVATVDGWWTPAHVIGTTPSSTAAFVILEGSCPAMFIGLSDDSATPVIGDTTLASEITTNGLGRALATYAHTASSNTFSLSYTWTATAAQSVRKAGMFTGGYGTAGGGILVAELAFTPLVMATDDTLALTWTWTLPAPG